MELVLYSLPSCPKCRILKDKLEKENMTFSVVMDQEAMRELGITNVPQLAIDGNLLEFGSAVKWINSRS